MLSGKADVEGRKRRRKRDRGKAGAGKSTLNRLELTPPEADEKSRYKKIVLDTAAVDDTLVNLYIQRQRRQPRQIVLDLDATDDRLHGHQQGRFFHGYYGHYCYLPLYIFIGEHLLCARLRESNQDAAAGAVEELERIVKRLRRTWPEVEIIVRGDAGFCRQELMSWCEKQQVDYVFGLAKNNRLLERIRKPLRKAQRRHAESGHPARLFSEFRYRTLHSWSRKRRVVAKAECLRKGKNPRFVVTSLPARQRKARSFVRGSLLRAGRDGKPYQGATVGPVCRPHLDGADAIESDPLVFFFDRLLLTASAKGVGAAGNEDGPGAVLDDPGAAAQNGGPGAGDGAQGVDLDGHGPSGAGLVRGGLRQSRARRAAALLTALP